MNFEDFGDDDVDLDDVGGGQERVRNARRSLALGQHSCVSPLAYVGQLVADLGPRPGRCRRHRRGG